MATIFNESTIAANPTGKDAARAHLITQARVPGTGILLDRLTLGPGGQMRLAVPPTSVAWLQVLDGRAVLAHGESKDNVSDAHVAFLPPGFSATLTSPAGAALLYGEIPDAARFDANFAHSPPPFRIADWTREPVLDSEHDARKRVYLVTPKLFGTKAVKGEMIIYPPGTAAANHHHEGAEHFMFAKVLPAEALAKAGGADGGI